MKKNENMKKDPYPMVFGLAQLSEHETGNELT